MKLISAVNVRDVAQILDEYLAEGQPRMAQVIRSVLIDVLKKLSMREKYLLVITLH